jgi:hypothetical protein
MTEWDAFPLQDSKGLPNAKAFAMLEFESSDFPPSA